MTDSTAIALLSGGLDSATAAALALEAGHRVIGLSFDYGQRHRRELDAAAALASTLGLAEHHTIAVNLASWGGSSLTDTQQVIPTGGVEEGVIPSTYVPGRNTVFISIGLSLAEARGADRIVLGVNAVDYSGYPDCRPDYLAAFQTLADLSSKVGREGHGPQLWAPLVTWRKRCACRCRSIRPGGATAVAPNPAGCATAAASAMTPCGQQAGPISAATAIDATIHCC